jgi:hypothetical protein
METITRTNRLIAVLAVLFCAALAVSVGFVERADSKRFSKKVIKSVSKKRLAGAYKGVTEQGTAVSFRLTRAGKIIDFVIPITLSCATEVGGGEPTQSFKTTTLRSAPLTGRKKIAQYPFGMTFEYESPPIPADQPSPGTEVVEYSIKVKFDEDVTYNVFRPIPKSAARMNGEVMAGTRNAPLNSVAPGSEFCALTDDGQVPSHFNALDFDAKKTGR